MLAAVVRASTWGWADGRAPEPTDDRATRSASAPSDEISLVVCFMRIMSGRDGRSVAAILRNFTAAPELYPACLHPLRKDHEGEGTRRARSGCRPDTTSGQRAVGA